MSDDEAFIQVWEEYRKKGMPRYILTRSLITTVVYWLVIVMWTLIKRNDFQQLAKSISTFIVLLIAHIIWSAKEWSDNEEKYKHLLSNNKIN